jgi:ankyrin repeat protein
MMAASAGDIPGTDLLLKAGADPNRRADDGETALGRALLGTHTVLGGRLVAGGAGVDQRGAGGLTPLIIAVRTGHTPSVQMLLAAGADPDARDGNSGNTPLMYAANHGFQDLVELLLANGADPTLHARDGWTALKAAEMVGETGIMAALRSAGASE